MAYYSVSHPFSLKIKNIQESIHGHHDKFDQKFEITKFIQHHSTPITPEQIGKDILIMDNFSNSTMSLYFANEYNASDIATHLRPLLKNYSLQQITNGLKYLTHSWSTQRTAELLIKLFYGHGMHNVHFISIIQGLTSDWNSNWNLDSRTQKHSKHLAELVVFIVIGESPSVMATFFHLLTSNMELCDCMALIAYVTSRLKWTVETLQQIIDHWIQQLLLAQFDFENLRNEFQRQSQVVKMNDSQRVCQLFWYLDASLRQSRKFVNTVSNTNIDEERNPLCKKASAVQMMYREDRCNVDTNFNSVHPANTMTTNPCKHTA